MEARCPKRKRAAQFELDSPQSDVRTEIPNEPRSRTISPALMARKTSLSLFSRSLDDCQPPAPLAPLP
jgi:hypothetical protein